MISLEAPQVFQMIDFWIMIYSERDQEIET